MNTSLLLGTAAFERALGDVSSTLSSLSGATTSLSHTRVCVQVYLTVSEATMCPPLLRDLLATTELEKTLGKSIVSDCMH